MFDDEYVRFDCHRYTDFAHEHHSDAAFECDDNMQSCANSQDQHEDPSILQKFSDIQLGSRNINGFNQQLFNSHKEECDFSEGNLIENFIQNQNIDFNPYT